MTRRAPVGTPGRQTPGRPVAYKLPEYWIWASMCRRCETASDTNYAKYAGRGIRVCIRWRNSFWCFYDDMGPRPTKQHTIERKDNDGDYEPGNCVWASKRQQARNKRSTHWLEHNGERLSVAEWADRIGITPFTLLARIRLGWSTERALTQPLRGKAQYGNQRTSNATRLKTAGKDAADATR